VSPLQKIASEYHFEELISPAELKEESQYERVLGTNEST
jgi:hypothetical protein